MSDYFLILLGLISGFCLSVFYFGGLWLTTKQISRRKGSIAILMGSFALRLVFCVVGFYLILTFSGISGMLAGTAGFVLTQLVLVRFLHRKDVRND